MFRVWGLGFGVWGLGLGNPGTGTAATAVVMFRCIVRSAACQQRVVSMASPPLQVRV